MDLSFYFLYRSGFLYPQKIHAYVYFLLFSSRIFIVSPFTFRFMVHFKLIWYIFQGSSYCSFFPYKDIQLALAGWLCWLECHATHQKVAGLIPSQGTNLRLWVWSLGCIPEAMNWFFSLCLCLSLSLKLINISSSED